jgi:U3 small nucleolar RNA-associated protein 18
MSVEVEPIEEVFEDTVDSEKSDSEPEEQVILRTEPQAGKRKRSEASSKQEEIEERQKQIKKILFGGKEEFLENLDKKHFIRDKSGFEEDDDRDDKPAVWKDSDDEVQEEFQEEKLKRKFNRISGQPSWASKKEVASDSDEDDIVRSVGFLSKSAKKSVNLPKEFLSFKKLKDLNRATYAEGAINSILFHPGSSVGIVSGWKGFVTIYAIDGRENKKIHNIRYENFPIFCTRLCQDGDQLISGSNESHFYTYKMLSGQTQRVRLPKEITHMKQFELSPDGKVIAVIGRFGEIHLLDVISKELITSLKQEHKCTSLSFSPDSSKLFCHSDDSEVTIFDLKVQRAMHRFVDEGCVNGQTLSLSPNGRLLATGSRQGVVNIYDYDKVFLSKYPKAEKAIMNLTTSISGTVFNPASEILAISSKEVKDAVKLVHLQSGTVFSNFPNTQDSIGSSNVLAFSPAGGYFSIGTSQGKALLYRLRHYSNY